MNEEQAKRTMLADMAVLKPCILCGQPTFGRGMFYPNDSTKYGGNANQQRIIIYGYCELEPEDGSTAEMIEDILGAEFPAK